MPMTPEQIEVVRQMAWLAMDNLDAQAKDFMCDTAKLRGKQAKEALWAILDVLPPRPPDETHAPACGCAACLGR